MNESGLIATVISNAHPYFEQLYLESSYFESVSKLALYVIIEYTIITHNYSNHSK